MAVASALVVLGLAGSASAASINVLWYSGGVEVSGGVGGGVTYKNDVNALALPGAGDPSSATWNITYWDGGAAPVGTYNVLVVASPQGGWQSSPDYTALDSAVPTVGDRLLVTAQDADWHFTNSPGPANFDNPRGFLRDSINWAGNGTGMGLVVLGGDEDVLDAFGLSASLGPSSGSTNDVEIPGIFASFPINTGLTSGGLSDWETSAHDIWTSSDPTLWTGINTAGSGPGFVTLVSKATAGGTIAGGGVPEPTAWALMMVGFGSVGAMMRRRRQLAFTAA